MGVPPKVLQDMQQAGGRHYRGRGLGTVKAWSCVSCGAANTGPLARGCASCGAGAPGRQVRRPGEPIEKAGGERREATQTAHAGTSLANPRQVPPPAKKTTLAEQLYELRHRAPVVDYDEIERRVARALEERLGGGYTAAERQTLLQALEVYIALWDDGTIEPGGGLSLEATRQLAQKIAPEDMEIESYGGTESTTASTRQQDAGYVGDDGDPNTFGYEHGPAGGIDDRGADGSHEPGVVVTRRAAAPRAGAGVRPAPELVDPDHRGDEGGEDDAAGDGG